MRFPSSLVCLVIVARIGATSFAAADDGPPTFKVTAKQPADRVEVAWEAGTTIFTVRSPSGIGQATVERSAAKWPAKIMLRLRLAGLEHFRVSSGKVTLHVSVSSHADRQRIRVWKDGDENTPLDPKNPLWIDVRMFDEKGNPTESIPLKNGYFELQLPPALFDGAPKSITLHWIDFYRN